MSQQPIYIEKPLTELLASAAREVMASCGAEDIPDVYLEIPKNREHGDVASNIALRCAKLARKKPLDLAGDIAAAMTARLDADTELAARIAKITPVAPGFINIALSNAALYEVAANIIAYGEAYGAGLCPKKEKVQIEFVSANPTGPLSVAHGRQAAIGDSLANILAFAGYEVTREYYLNDEGTQIEILGRSLQARYLEKLGKEHAFPDNGYKGDYLYDIAQKMIDAHGEVYVSEADLGVFSEFALQDILAGIKVDLTEFRVQFDVWRSQREMAAGGAVEKILAFLDEKKFLFEEDGALWFRTTDFGDDKDRVVRKSDGSYTYLAPDIAYHNDKFARGFDKVIDILGPDHHGYIARIKAAVCALGYDRDALEVLIVQLAKLFKGETQIRMSTRAGEFISLREVFEEVGVDTARFFFLMRRRDSHLDFDMELAKQHSLENPVYYIQYAYARISSIFEFVRSEQGEATVDPSDEVMGHLTAPEELELMRALREFPETIMACAKQLEPFILTSYLQDIAAKFHYFYTIHRVITDDKELSAARLCLIKAVHIILENGLKLLGMTRPEKM